MPIAEQARLLAESHSLKYSRAVMHGHKADALWHRNQFIIWSKVNVRFS